MTTAEMDAVRKLVRSEIASAVTVTQYDVKEQDADRQALEDLRAIRRNRNRFLTLLAALGIGLCVTYLLTTPGILPKWMLHYAPYSFVITVLLDSGLAAYAYIRRY